MRSLAIILLAATSVFCMDWQDAYNARHPNREVKVKTESECAMLTDTSTRADCVKEVQAGYAFEAKTGEFKDAGAQAEEPYILDEQRTTTISGGDTTVVITQTKSRSGRAVADGLDGIKSILAWELFIGVASAVITVIAVAAH